MSSNPRSLKNLLEQCNNDLDCVKTGIVDAVKGYWVQTTNPAYISGFDFAVRYQKNDGSAGPKKIFEQLYDTIKQA